MTLKDLLVHVDNSSACSKRIDAALRLAQAHEARLTGVYILPDLHIPTYAEAQIPVEVITRQRELARADAAEAGKAFQRATQKSGVSSEWRLAEGDFERELIVHARYADLIITGQTDESDAMSVPGLSEAVVLNSGRPVLVIPYIGAGDTIGQRVLIAWNGSREAVRALHDAMPLLVRAQRVSVLAVNPPGAGEAIPGADISLHLARHGVNAEAQRVEAHDIAVGDMLLSRAAEQSADLMVMGAYGRSRFRELVLGGATRHILHHMTVPVLMAH